MPTSSVRKQVAVLMEWFPLIGMVTALGDTQRGVPRVVATLQILRFVAAKTSIKQDDELLARLEAICLTPEGKVLIDYIADQIQALTIKAIALAAESQIHK